MSDASQEVRSPATGFPSYLYTHGSWFLAFGLQTVLFPYLVRVVLQESEVRFGLAQMAMQGPTTLLILVGGFFADRLDGKRTMLFACAMASVFFLTLFALVQTDHLNYPLIIAYAIVVGTLGAFMTPARDALLSQVAPDTSIGGIQKAVAFASLTQFGAQIVGMLFAAIAPLVGVANLLLGQAALMASAVFAITRVHPRPARKAASREGVNPLVFMASEIKVGIDAVVASPVMSGVMIMAIAMGVFFMGAFFVILPLIVESYHTADIAAGGARTQVAAALGIFSLCFWSGSMVSALTMVRLPPPRYKGRVYLASLACGGTVLMLCGLSLPFWGLCALNFVWGLGGGVAMTLGRGLMQEHAPEDKRARVLSIFTLGNMGGGPIGAVAYGYLCHAIGAHMAVLIPGALMLVTVGLVYAFSGLRRLGE